MLCPVSARNARAGKESKMHIADGIYTHFIGKAQMKVGGRLENECKSISEMFRAMTKDSIIFMDESFSSTSAYDGTLIATEVIKHLREKGCRCIYATHMHDIANKAEEINEMPGESKVDLLSVNSGENPYRVERKRGQGKSFAMEIFKNTVLTSNSKNPARAGFFEIRDKRED